MPTIQYKPEELLQFLSIESFHHQVLQSVSQLFPISYYIIQYYLQDLFQEFIFFIRIFCLNSWLKLIVVPSLGILDENCAVIIELLIVP